MDRRKSLKLIAAGALAGGAIATGCNTSDENVPVKKEPEFTLDRNPDELKREKEILAKEMFFNGHEMATIGVLVDIIIPADNVSGSASEAMVPDFLEFIVKDKPEHQVPLRGGLKWLDLYSLKKFEKSFKDLLPEQQIAIVEEIAYPEKAAPGVKAGAKFFSLLRNLTATGFYTSEIGIKDLGYIGNTVNQWNGVPPEVLQQYNLAYTEKELKECISFS